MSGTRWPALDGVRGLAILVVMAHRFDVVADTDGIGRALSTALNLGWIGVQLFFVLSGFLITFGLLDIRRAKNFYATFFARRALRIFPLYFGTLIVAFWLVPALVALDPRAQADLAHQGWVWTFLLNWVLPFGIDVHGLSHFWSLAVEEQFYLVWPFLVRTLSQRALAGLAIGLLGLAPLTRIAVFSVFDAATAQEAAYTFTIARIDALALGALIAVAWHDPTLRGVVQRRWRGIAAAAALGLALGAIPTHGYAAAGPIGQGLGYTLLAAAFGALIVAALATDAQARHPMQRGLCWRPLRACGHYSYAMYVVHAPLHLFVLWPAAQRAWGPGPWGWPDAMLYLALASLVTFVIGAASYRCIERPILALKRYAVARFDTAATQ